ncbi:CocE/NonD family hydrolase [Actinomadura madurae]|uniref:CocE/NonD family hydrolase n=1 Tax=Actinomadura madurae TaxID=1993 RepID=UPI0034DAF39C
MAPRPPTHRITGVHSGRRRPRRGLDGRPTRADGQLATRCAEYGYNGLVCTTRGSGESPGRVDPFSPLEQRDNYDVIEWLAVQPWSDGQIGQMGNSYGALVPASSGTRGRGAPGRPGRR